MSKTLIVLHVLNVIIGSLCIVVLGLTAHSIVVKDRANPPLPSNIKDTSTGMLIWAGCGGIVDMLLFLCLLSAKPLRRNARNMPSALYQNIVLFVVTFILLRPLIILIYTYVEYHGSIKSSTSTADGYLTSESWACYLGTSSDAHALCNELRAARYLLIPILILGVGMPAIVLWIRTNMSSAEKA
ncbi:hypothetical protein K505DRAFT_331162 [Melanomma pulvis-pyrius CBS 109.77]|uniref:Uncharacterized protein n=1 Tax=Melanomma pulvis-pyrius CBS 109.77 TaxID=1314802 RepID=A0A6A6XXS2_9PLEO|nr:hypothetical protein K505DRAFT_331162 [Melanomma pulvis-pyrius CBS 109.77]